MDRYFEQIAGVSRGNYVYYWKSKGLSDERINSIKTSNHIITANLSYSGTRTRVEFNGSCFKQNKVTFNHKRVANIYIVYEITASSSNNADPILRNSLFGAVRLTKNTDIDKYQYSGYGIGFDRRGAFSFPGGGFGGIAMIFGVDKSSSVHVDNKKKGIFISGKGPAQGLEHTLTAEKMYSINCTVTGKKFCLILHYNGANSYLFVNGTEIHKFKAKDSEIVATPFCLGNISKNWSADLDLMSMFMILVLIMTPLQSMIF